MTASLEEQARRGKRVMTESHPIVANVARVGVDGAYRSTIPVTAFLLVVCYLVANVSQSQTVVIFWIVIGLAGSAVRRGLRYLLARKMLVALGDAGISVNGRLRIPYEQMVDVLPLVGDGRSVIRVDTRRGGFLITLPTEDERAANDLALAIDARANLRVRTFFLRRRFLWGALVGLVGVALTLVAASREGSVAFANASFAMALFGLFVARIGPRVRLRVGRDGVEIALLGFHMATLRASDGLQVEAEYGRVRLITSTRAVVFRVPGYEAGLVADKIRAALRSDGADVRLVIPPLTQGAARSWIDAVRRRPHTGDYRGRLETPEDLRAVIADGTRAPTERIYAALRLRALGEGDALLETARNTTISPRLRVSLEAELGGDDEALVNELEALAVEEAASTRAPRREA